MRAMWRGTHFRVAGHSPAQARANEGEDSWRRRGREIQQVRDVQLVVPVPGDRASDLGRSSRKGRARGADARLVPRQPVVGQLFFRQEQARFDLAVDLLA
jgi:hypothetical protein